MKYIEFILSTLSKVLKTYKVNPSGEDGVIGVVIEIMLGDWRQKRGYRKIRKE